MAATKKSLWYAKWGVTSKDARRLEKALGALADNEGSIHEAMSDRGVTLDPNTIGEVCSGIRHILDGWEK